MPSIINRFYEEHGSRKNVLKNRFEKLKSAEKTVVEKSAASLVNSKSCYVSTAEKERITEKNQEHQRET